MASWLPLPCYTPFPGKGGLGQGSWPEGVPSCLLLCLRTVSCPFAFQGESPKCSEPGVQDSPVRPWAGGWGPATLLGQLLPHLPGPLETSP